MLISNSVCVKLPAEMLDVPFSVQKNEEVGPPYPFPASTAQVSDVTRWLNPAEMLDVSLFCTKE